MLFVLLFYFSALDYERVISHHIQQDDFSSALEVLKTKVRLTVYYYVPQSSPCNKVNY